MSVQDAIDLLRAAAIAEAQRSIPKGISPDSISLVSARTGLSRRTVRDTLAAARGGTHATQGEGHRGERVLAGWWHDADFRDQRGQPRILPISKGAHSFEALCRRYSGERQYRTILKDLEQRGAVSVLEDGDHVQVLRQSYAAVGWTEAGQMAMAEQLAEHIETCLHNFKHPEGSQYWVCRRVANPLLKPQYAGILLRDLRTQIDDLADGCYDALTDPHHTADPLDPRAEGMSVSVYIHRTPAASPPASPSASETSPKTNVAPSIDIPTAPVETTSKRKVKSRGRLKRRK